VLDCDLTILHVEAANDLKDADLGSLRKHPVYNALRAGAPVGVAACVLPHTTETFRATLAAACNEQLRAERSAAA
jgi:hypothetical protein